MTKQKLIGIFWMFLGLCVAFGGVKEFDNADTAIEFLRGLFWLIVGMIVFGLGQKDYRKK